MSKHDATKICESLYALNKERNDFLNLLSTIQESDVGENIYGMSTYPKIIERIFDGTAKEKAAKAGNIIKSVKSNRIYKESYYDVKSYNSIPYSIELNGSQARPFSTSCPLSDIEHVYETSENYKTTCVSSIYNNSAQTRLYPIYGVFSGSFAHYPPDPINDQPRPDNKLKSFHSSSLTSIMPRTFYRCSSQLSSISLPKAKYFGSSSFSQLASGGSKMTYLSIYAPELTCIDYAAFWSDAVLTSLEFPNLSVFNNGYQFIDCINLSSVTFKNIHMINDSTFLRCRNLQEVNIPEINIIKNSGFRGVNTNSQKILHLSCSYLSTIAASAFMDSKNIILDFTHRNLEDPLLSSCTLQSDNVFKTTYLNTISCIIPEEIKSEWMNNENWQSSEDNQYIKIITKPNN